MATRAHTAASGRKLIIGFVAGFLAGALFHQPVLELLTQVGFAEVPT